MAEGSARLAAVAIDFDRQTWLSGPDDPADNDAWLDAVHAAGCTQYSLDPASPQGEMLRQILSAFVRRDVGPRNKFLRLGELVASPLVATVAVAVGLEAGQGHLAYSHYDPDRRYHDAPRLEMVDEERGLQRALRFVVERDDRISSSVRYFRRVDDLDADVLVVCEGGDTIVTAQALPDLDDLARSVWLLDDSGRRR